jgi:hypothetical protein
MTKQVQIEGLQRILKKLQPKELWGHSFRRFFDRSGETVLNEARLNAPVKTARTITSLGRGASDNVYDLDPNDLPAYLRVGTRVNRNGFPYPRALNDSDRYHHRSKTGFGLKGKPTKGWFTDSLKRAMPQIRSYLGQMRAEIKQKWNKR